MSARLLKARSAYAPARLLAAMLALVAMALQCFVIQTHVHEIDFTRLARAELASLAAPADQARYSTPATPTAPEVCPICQELAVAGAFVHAATPEIAIVERASLLVVSALYAPVVARRASHHWQGRAPPISL